MLRSIPQAKLNKSRVSIFAGDLMYKNNLWRAFRQLMGPASMVALLLNIDRLGNAICAGDYRATVSGRVGYHAQKLQAYWIVLEWVIDSTFYPVDGKNHCNRAYQWEKAKGFSHRRGNDIALALLSVLVVAGCAILAPLIWLCSLFKR